MAVYEMLVTDVTNYGTLFCVAGVTEDGRMIRPEPHSASATNEVSRFWSDANAGPGRALSAGNVVSFEANDPPHDFPYPHATEDRLIPFGGACHVKETVPYAEIPRRARASVSPSLNHVFDGAVIRAPSGKPYVPKGNQGRSLGAIEIDPGQLHFHVNDYNPNKLKLRAYLEDQGVTFDVPVTADDVNTCWRQQGLDGVREALGKFRRAHVRLGLSRPFAARPMECYVQINGVYLFDD